MRNNFKEHSNSVIITLAFTTLVSCGGSGGGAGVAIDSDGDGLSDEAEASIWLTDPANPDTDNDGLQDGAEVNTHGTSATINDTDGDGLLDGFEVNFSFDPLTPGEQLLDSDTDELDNLTEQTLGTNPVSPDTDGDGLTDGNEQLRQGTDPLVATDTITVKDGTVVVATRLQQLGDNLYNDINLSQPAGQACASCHTPATGFDDPDDSDPTSLGVDGVSIGSRNSPTASYAAHIPDFAFETRPGPGMGPPVQVPVGGQFWDGRAESLEEQAKAPFLNPVEMANASKSDVIDKVKLATYADDFRSIFGANVLDDVDSSYDYIADAIAAFERTEFFSPFTSEFDQVAAGTAVFSSEEERGRNLFNGKAQCNTCHATGNGAEMFSNFEYFNIGVPENPGLVSDLAAQGIAGFVDNGLGDVTANPVHDGRFRTSSLRNIAITAPYMHNGVFTTLNEVINFYNRRDLDSVVPEVANNVDDRGNIGELGLTPGEISDLVAFLNTLTDQ